MMLPITEYVQDKVSKSWSSEFCIRHFKEIVTTVRALHNMDDGTGIIEYSSAVIVIQGLVIKSPCVVLWVRKSTWCSFQVNFKVVFMFKYIKREMNIFKTRFSCFLLIITMLTL